MQIHEWATLILLVFLLIILAKPLGVHLNRVLDPQGKTFLDPLLKPIERLIYRWSGIDPEEEQDWKHYLLSLLSFSLVAFLFTALILSIQSYLPLNPEHFKAPSWDLTFNTSVSFLTNTNWQSYSGESTMSHFTQMTALTVQNFVSPAVSVGAAAALVRGFARKESRTIGCFWTDLIRVTLYLLLPLAIAVATLFISEGVPQNFKANVQVHTLEGAPQSIPQGPIASQEAIKMLGSSGGGFFSANSAHPYENPTPFTNFIQMLLILLIPVTQIYSFALAVKDGRHGWYIIASLGIVFAVGFFLCFCCEMRGNPELASSHLTEGNWEGKEQRFGIFSSALFACATTSASCGAVNCMHDSLTPIGGMIPLLNIQLSDVIFGGVGAGLYHIISYIILAIFIAGLIIGRTPEYLGKKIEPFEMKMTILALLSYVILVLSFTAWAGITAWGLQGLKNTGPHGFSEILYAYSSTAANNGSAFAGLSANTMPYNVTLGMAMLLGRFLFMAPMIAMGGSLAEKKIHPTNLGSFPISSLVFIILLIGTILIQGVLTFLPALTMGPVLEQFFMLKGVLFP